MKLTFIMPLRLKYVISETLVSASLLAATEILYWSPIPVLTGLSVEQPC